MSLSDASSTASLATLPDSTASPGPMTSSTLAAGGQDDLIAVWQFNRDASVDNPLVARLEGHSSWVTSVMFDSSQPAEDGRYFIGSVADDGKLCIWHVKLRSTQAEKAATVDPGSAALTHRFSAKGASQALLDSAGLHSSGN